MLLKQSKGLQNVQSGQPPPPQSRPWGGVPREGGVAAHLRESEGQRAFRKSSENSAAISPGVPSRREELHVGGPGDGAVDLTRSVALGIAS